MKPLSLTIALTAAAANLILLNVPPARADALDLRNLCQSENAQDRVRCTAFINGVVGGIAESPHPSICFPPSYDSRTSQIIVNRYMWAHPEGLGVPPAKIVEIALTSTFPCSDAVVPAVTLGVAVQDLTPSRAQGFRINASGGVVVQLVRPHSPAEKAGLQIGDVITAVDGEAVLDTKQLRERISAMQLGQTAKLSIWRDNRELVVSALLAGH